MKVTLFCSKIILFGNNISYFVYQIWHLKKKSISRKKKSYFFVLYKNIIIPLLWYYIYKLKFLLLW